MTLRLNSYLNTNPELGYLSYKAEQFLALQRFYDRTAPASLSNASHVVCLTDYILIVATQNSAVAAKLRQLAPALTHAFQDGGHEVTAIQVKVQVTPPPRPPRQPKPLSATGKRQLADFAKNLHDSPLKMALNRLIVDKVKND